MQSVTIHARSETQAPGGFPENPAFRFRIDAHLVHRHAQELAIRCLGTPDFARDVAPPTQRSGRFGLVVNAITTAQGLIEAWGEKAAAKHVIDNVTT
jgi:hypothetical protein